MKPTTIILAIMILAAAARAHAQEPAGDTGSQRITVETARYEGYQYYDTDQLFIMAHCMLESGSDDNYRVTFRIVNKSPNPTAVKVARFKAWAESALNQRVKEVTVHTHTGYLNDVRRAEVANALIGGWAIGFNMNSAQQRATTISMAEGAAISDSYLDTCLLQEGQMVDGFVYIVHSEFHQRLKVTACVGDKDYDFEWRIGADKCAPVK